MHGKVIHFKADIANFKVKEIDLDDSKVLVSWK